MDLKKELTLESPLHNVGKAMPDTHVTHLYTVHVFLLHVSGYMVRGPTYPRSYHPTHHTGGTEPTTTVPGNHNTAHCYGYVCLGYR